ncbi:hypothetical protein QBC45DRAFT_400297 [Copromyces sp. CBS 386.78]|nr:hypothetical protein QBC45DRAFT_400297 [Copromyces sp. CBS 386.78]
MAFYSAEVQGLPTGGVAIVDTDFNTTATWYNATMSATWMDTGVTFKAVIGYHVAEDDYVGKGNNGYGDFRCWQRAKTGFAYYLKRDGNVCEMRIDCNKAAAPSTDSAYVPLESTTDDGQAAGSPATGSSPATSSSSSSSSSSNPGGNAPQPGLNNKDKTTISTGAVIGIAIGIVGAFTFLAGGAGFLFARRRRRIRKQREQQQQQGKGAMTESTITEAYAPGSDLVKSDPNAVHEMDGGWYRHEMGEDTGHYEIDGQVRCEMDGEEAEIKEKMDDSFGEAGVKEVIILNEKGDAKKAILDEKKGQVRVSEKEKEVRRDKEERERERQQ